MDETLLRRLIGAVVLLGGALGVAALLPDPATAPSAASAHSVTYDLRTGERVGAPAAPAAEPPASEPSRTVPATPEPTDAAAEEAALEPDPEPAGWYVQVGSFESEGNAKSALQRLYTAGQPARLQAVRVGKGYWFRVRVGPYPQESQAKGVLENLSRQGYRGGKVVLVEPAPADAKN
jgi:cell division protein FtsN